MLTAPETSATPIAPKSAPAAPAAPDVAEEPRAIKAYGDFLKEFIDPFVALSEKVDPLVLKQAEALKAAFYGEKTFLWAASLSKKQSPTDSSFQDALKPINAEISKVVDIKDQNRTSKFYNNLNTVAEGVPVLGWICVETPVSFIPDFKDASQFWSNRVMKDNKDTNQDQVEWARSFSKIFDGLKAFAKEYETTGPSWNAQGGDFADEYKKLAGGAEKAAAPAPPAAGGPPPPPPPPPASVFEAKQTPVAASSGTGMNAVFSQLNQGEGITKGLKKVEKSQMTHKNPALRASSTVPAVKESSKPVPPKKPSSLSEKKTVAKPATKELVDSKWMITNYQQASEPIVLEVDMGQSVFIANSENIVVQLKGKVNQVTINSCKKVGVVVEKGISSLDVIKSSHIELQIMESIPTISVDQSDSLTIYLSKTSLATEIYSSSTTALNIEVPDADDMKELSAPEQFKHTYDAKTGKLETVVVEHAA